MACRNVHPPELAAKPPCVLGGQEGVATRCLQPPGASAHQPLGHRTTQAASAGGDGQRVGCQKEKHRKVRDGPRSGACYF